MQRHVMGPKAVEYLWISSAAVVEGRLCRRGNQTVCMPAVRIDDPLPTRYPAAAWRRSLGRDMRCTIFWSCCDSPRRQIDIDRNYRRRANRTGAAWGLLRTLTGTGTTIRFRRARRFSEDLLQLRTRWQKRLARRCRF